MFDNPVFVVILLVIVAALGAAAGFFAGRAKGQDMARGAKESDLNEAKAQIEADKQDISDLNAAVRAIPYAGGRIQPTADVSQIAIGTGPACRGNARGT